MGGDIVLETALKNDAVKALIGIDNFKDVGLEMTDELNAEMQGFMTILKENFSTIAPAYAQAALFHPETDSTIVNQVMKDFAESDSLSAIASLTSFFDYTQQESMKLSGLKQKLYLIHSETTPANIEGLEATGVDFEVMDITGTGHYPMIERPEQTNLLLRDILTKITSSAQKE